MSNLKRKVADTAIMILAAGNSSRLGQPKQLVKFRGKSLLNGAIEEGSLSSIKDIFIILGNHSYDHKRQLPRHIKVDVAINEAWEWGMGNSLRFGLQYALLKEPNLKAIIVSVCDQPFLEATVLDSMVTAFQQSPEKIVACKYQNDAFGVPVLFPEKYFNDLLLCEDSVGAKSIVKRHLENVIFVPFGKGYIDIDTPEDLLKLEKENIPR